MNKFTFSSLLLLLFSGQIAMAIAKSNLPLDNTNKDSARIAELDRYWERLNNAVMEGDLEGFKNCFHEDAVIVFASGENKTSVPIATALEFWKEAFKSTNEGKNTVNIAFRFSQRIGNETTAYESGIFINTFTDSISKKSSKAIIPFDMLLVKRNNQWYAMMEHQKPFATQEEWDALE